MTPPPMAIEIITQTALTAIHHTHQALIDIKQLFCFVSMWSWHLQVVHTVCLGNSMTPKFLCLGE